MNAANLVGYEGLTKEDLPKEVKPLFDELVRRVQSFSDDLVHQLRAEPTVFFADPDVDLEAIEGAKEGDIAVWIDEDGFSRYRVLPDGTDGVGPYGVTVNTTTRITVGPYTPLATDYVIFCNTDGGAITVNLPPGIQGTHLKLINCGSSGNELTVDPNGIEQLYGGGAGVAVTLIDVEIIDIHYDAIEGWY